MPRRAFVHRLSAAAPDDVSGLAAAIAEGRIRPEGIVAILGKTEGNGCVNDFTRAFAVQSLQLELRRHLPAREAEAVCCVMSGGTEGGLAPHWLVLERRETEGVQLPLSRSVVRGRVTFFPKSWGGWRRWRLSLSGFEPRWPMRASPTRLRCISCRSNAP